jgi:hypothetical protein
VALADPTLQGYLAHKKPHPSRSPPGPTVGSWGGAFSYERGTPGLPKTGTRSPKPYTQNPTITILRLKPGTRNPQAQTQIPIPQPKTFKPQTPNPRAQTPKSGPHTPHPNPKHQTPNTKHQTPNTKHQTPNTKHQTPNTKP